MLLRLVLLSAGIVCATVHAVSGLSRPPHILVTSAYMRFSACHNFHRYNFRELACDFTLVTFFARTSHAGVHALSGLSRLPHVLFLPRCMRFSACHVFRMYYFCRSTCTFRLVTISARTISAGRHAVSRLSHFPHVLVAPAYMRFSACHNFCMYHFCRRTCDFRLATISAGRISAGVHAVSRLSHFPHVLFLPGYMRFHACPTFHR